MKALLCVILVLAVLLSSILARPQAIDGRDEEEKSWPIGTSQKYKLRRYENENKYHGVNTEEANIEHASEHYNCFADPKCRAPLDVIDCCFGFGNYIKILGRCCPCFGPCPFSDPE